jgi:CRP/FNR family transcriptional regulator, cyclic AMP receptor protein
VAEVVHESQIDKAVLLRRVGLFAELSDETIDALARLARVAVYPAGDEIVQQDAEFDEELDGIFLIVSGSVEVRRDSTDETDGTLLMALGAGEFFGEMSLLDGKPRSASVYAVEETQCLVLHRWDFMRELRKNPDIAVGMLGALSQRLRAMDEAVGHT